MEMSSVYACDSHARLPPGRPSATYKDTICRGVWGHAPQKIEPSESGSEAL